MNAHIAQDESSPWVNRFAGLIPAGRVLDLACGGGRHSRLLVGWGHSVLAVDRDPAALAAASGPGIVTLQFDLEHPEASRQPDWPLTPGRFNGIVVSNYLHRPLTAALFDSLAPGGILIYETFAAGNGQFGKPSNPAFLLNPGELLEWARSQPACHVIAFEDGYQYQPRPAMVQRICLRKADGLSVFPAEGAMLDHRTHPAAPQ
jgi:SAM-dependent methyltransferase